MGVNWKDKWSVPVTAVSNEFIDSHMALANGEYVKVYIYILRHQGEEVTVEEIADALNHTESDVKRALSYWEKAGVLFAGETQSGQSEPQEQTGPQLPQSSGQQSAPQLRAAQEQAAPQLRTAQEQAALQLRAGQEQAAARMQPPEQADVNAGAAVRTASQPAAPQRQAPVYSAEQVNRLCGDEEFSQLLYIAQKYMNKVFTPRDCQVFAYLYEGLGMGSELLEYLVEYCAQNDHTSVRYLEAVALSWHEKGIKTAQDAKDFSSSYTRDAFAVMKAFGLNSRKPAAPEQKLMDKWFKDYGFTKELVLEACSRTITAIHNPSFQYADKILTDWKKAGIRRLEDLRLLDEKRQTVAQETAQSREKRFQKYNTAAASAQGTKKGAPNQFHNFKQRDTDYDALMLKQVKEWMGQQNPDT